MLQKVYKIPEKRRKYGAKMEPRWIGSTAKSLQKSRKAEKNGAKMDPRWTGDTAESLRKPRKTKKHGAKMEKIGLSEEVL